MLGSSVSIADSKVGVDSLPSPTVGTPRALLSSLELTREWTLSTLNLLVFLMMSAIATGTKEEDTLLKQSAFKMSHLWGKEGSSQWLRTLGCSCRTGSSSRHGRQEAYNSLSSPSPRAVTPSSGLPSTRACNYPERHTNEKEPWEEWAIYSPEEWRSPEDPVSLLFRTLTLCPAGSHAQLQAVMMTTPSVPAEP